MGHFGDLLTCVNWWGKRFGAVHFRPPQQEEEGSWRIKNTDQSVEKQMWPELHQQNLNPITGIESVLRTAWNNGSPKVKRANNFRTHAEALEKENIKKDSVVMGASLDVSKKIWKEIVEGKRGKNTLYTA